MQPVWIHVADPEPFVRAILGLEAPEIPDELIAAAPWIEATLGIDQIQPDLRLIEDHDGDPRHIRRRDAFVTRIRNHEPIPPLIVLGRECALVDGYARYRALTALGVGEMRVLRQEFTSEAIP